MCLSLQSPSRFPFSLRYIETKNFSSLGGGGVAGAEWTWSTKSEMFFIIPAVHRIPFRSRQRMRQLCLLIRLHQFGHRHLDRTPSQKSMLFGIIFKYDKGCTNKVYLKEERQLFLLALICKLVHRLEELL